MMDEKLIDEVYRSVRAGMVRQFFVNAIGGIDQAEKRLELGLENAEKAYQRALEMAKAKVKDGE